MSVSFEVIYAIVNADFNNLIWKKGINPLICPTRSSGSNREYFNTKLFAKWFHGVFKIFNNGIQTYWSSMPICYDNKLQDQGLYTIQITKPLHKGEISIWYNSIFSTVNLITIKIMNYQHVLITLVGVFFSFFSLLLL